jgi:hypothetical protein
LTYTPNPGFFGSDTFTYTANDGKATSNLATVTVKVSAIIDNGTVQLGINPTGDLNVISGPSLFHVPVGLRYLPTGSEATAPGCLCEGWGVADVVTNVTGYANEAVGVSTNLEVLSAVRTASTVVVRIKVGNTFIVTHDYHPSPDSPNLYEDVVTIENISGAPVHVRYRRVMDWDVEPTPFSEFVTIETGNSAELVATTTNGFMTANPLDPPGPSSGDIVDVGPLDHGASFDFDFGTLGAGSTRTFTTLYGAAGTEVGALAALAAADAEVYSLGQPSTEDGPTLGTPNTFIFGFVEVGGDPVFNTAPVATPQSVSTPEDTATAITLAGTDVDGDNLAFAVVAGPTHGVLSGTAPNLTYTPNPDYSGPDSFTFTVNDGTVDSPTATVSITVTPVNDRPVATPQSVSTPEDTATAITLTGTDADGNPLTFAVGTAPTHGTLSGAAPNLTYTPDPDYSGLDSFNFVVNDGSLTSTAALVSITVTPLNDPPTANAQSVSTPRDTAKAITLTGNDIDGDSLTFAVVTGPSHGVLSGTAPNLTYTPDPGYSGPDSFSFRANDGTLDSTDATVSITVTPLNDAPVATPQSVTTAEDTAKAITLAGTDTDGDTLSSAIATGPTHGVLSGTAPNLTYTPDANYHGPDSFTFTVNDGTVDSAAATVSITVTPLNDAPVATPQSVSTPEDTAKAITLAGTDTDGNALTFAIASGPAHGTVTGTGANRTYTPAANYNGPDSFTFTVNDGTVDSAAATVSITVTPVNDPPTATPQSVSTPEDTATAVTLAGTDVDANALTVAIASGPAHGTLTGTGANRTYTPAANYNGPDSFTFTVNDGTVTSAAATVSITVTPVNDAPAATAQSVSTPEDTARAITLAGTDVDANALTFAIASGPSHGTLTGAGANRTYTPALDYTGPDSFTFTVNDGTVDSAPATVSITVTPVITGVSLLVSDDADRRVNVRELDGETFRGGVPIYAFVGPSDQVTKVRRVKFLLDGRLFSVETYAAFDFARTGPDRRGCTTCPGSPAYPFESNLLTTGEHAITAYVEFSNRAPMTLSARFTVTDTSSHRLLTSTSVHRTSPADLDGATVRGRVSLFLGDAGDPISGLDAVCFLLDGRIVTTERLAPYDLLGTTHDGSAVQLDTRKLRNGTHTLSAIVKLAGDDVVVKYTAVFTVAN